MRSFYNINTFNVYVFIGKDYMTSFLQEYQRQPKLFIDLPSKGVFYDESVLEGGQFVQIPVFGMNAMDEILFKTPDALFTGSATVEVIKSCIPTIIDPWKLVGFDIDYILVAIRIATYGDEMATSTKCPECDNENENNLSLTKLLGFYEAYSVNNSFTLDDLTFNLKPLTYRKMTDVQIENYTHERTLIQISGNNDLSKEVKDAETQKIYKAISDLNLRTAISYISSIAKGQNTEDDLQEISNFIASNDAKFFNKLKDSVTKLSGEWKMPDMNIKCANEECGHDYKSKVEMDYSSFFGLRQLHSRNLIS